MRIPRKPIKKSRIKLKHFDLASLQCARSGTPSSKPLPSSETQSKSSLQRNAKVCGTPEADKSGKEMLASLSPEELDRAFEAFHRVERTSAGVPGAGLGLSLSRQLARLMQGELKAMQAQRAPSGSWLRR